MSVSAAIFFTQGVSSSAPGVALIGTYGTSVTVANGNDANVVRWVYNVIDVSSLSALTLPIVQDGPSPTFVFTPDAPGGYLIQLTVYDISGNFAVDYREFQVAEVTGRFIGAFKSTDASLNFFIGPKQNLRGWATLMEPYLRLIDTFTFLDINTDANNASVSVTDAAHNQIVGFRNLSAPRTVVFPTAPSLGQRISVVDKDGSASGTNTITLNAGVLAIGTTSSTTFTFSNPYEGATFEWTGQIWALLTHVNGSALSTPGTPLAGSYTLLATDTWKYIQAVAGGYAINCQNLVVGQPVRLTHVGGAAGSNLFGTTGQNVILQQGSSSYVFVDPQNTIAATATSVALYTSGVTYTICLDPSGVVRSLGLS